MANTNMNSAAAHETENIMNNSKVKMAIAKIAKAGSEGFQAFLGKIHALNGMKDDEVREEVHGAFDSAKKRFKDEINSMNAIPSFILGFEVKDFEEAVNTFLETEKTIQNIQDIGKFRKVVLMFWSGVKFIAGLILKGSIKAAEFIAVYGIRIIAIGADFVIRLVKKVVKFAKTTWKLVKAVRVTKQGETQEVCE